MSDQSYRNSINSTGFLQLPKSLIKSVGYKDAFFLAILIDAHDKWTRYNNIRKAGKFYYTFESVCDDYGLSPYVQQKSIRRLVALGLITYEPDDRIESRTDKWFFGLNFGAIIKLIGDGSESKTETPGDGSESKTEEIDQNPETYDPPKTWGHTDMTPQKLGVRPPKNLGSDPPKTWGQTPQKLGVIDNYIREQNPIADIENRNLETRTRSKDTVSGEPLATDNSPMIGKPAIARDLIQSVIQKILEDDEPETLPGGQVKTPLIEIEENTHPINEAIDFSKIIKTENPTQPSEGEAPAERMSDDSGSAPLDSVPLNDEDFDMESFIKGAFKTMPNEA